MAAPVDDLNELFPDEDHRPLFPPQWMAPPNPAPPVPPLVVMMVPLVPASVAPPIPPNPAEVDEDEDEEEDSPPEMVDDSDDEDEYSYIDDGVIECVNPMPKASPSSMQVTSSRPDK